VYSDAAHAWTEPDAPVYDEKQAERAFEKLTAFLAAP
jgi:dienelactone hydrolase